MVFEAVCGGSSGSVWDGHIAQFIRRAYSLMIDVEREVDAERTTSSPYGQVIESTDE